MHNVVGILAVSAGLGVLLATAPAGAADRNFKADLESYQEVPSVSSAASGELRPG